MNSRGLLVSFTRCNAADREDAWEAWYDDVHLPDLLESGCIEGVSRFRLSRRPAAFMPSVGFTHVALYRLAARNGEAVRSAVRRVMDRDAELRAAGRIHPNHCQIGLDTLLEHGRFSGASAASGEPRGHILAYVLCNQPEREAEWDAWLDEVHVPDMLASGAFSGAHRFARLDRSDYAANFLTLYDVAFDDVEEAVTRSAAVMPAIVAAGRKLDCHAGGLVVTLAAAGRYGGAGLRA